MEMIQNQGTIQNQETIQNHFFSDLSVILYGYPFVYRCATGDP